MDEHRHLPDANRLSVLAATIMLAYALTPFISFPERDLGLQFPGFFLLLQFNLSTVTSVLVALLAASGADWLVQQHPHRSGRSMVPHWLLPALTAWVIGVPLTSLELGIEWWAVFAFGGMLLILVLVSEYIVLDPSDVRHGPASVGLTAVSFALFLVLSIAVRASGLRLYTLLVALVPAMFLVSLRTLYLQSGEKWHWGWAAVISLIVGQLAIGLHYLPLSPLVYSLLLLGLGYGLTSLAVAVEENRSWRVLWVEPLVMTLAIWMLAWLVGR